MKPSHWLILLALAGILVSGNARAQTRVLLIASSSGKGGGPFTTYIANPLTTAGYSVRTWAQASLGWPKLDTLRAYDVVFYHASERSTHKGIDSTLTAFASEGGRLVVEGTNVADWAYIYPEFTKRALHTRWARRPLVAYTYTVVDAAHMLTAGLPATFPSSGYNTVYTHDVVEAWDGGHRVLGYQNAGYAASATVYPRSVFFCGSLYRITSTAYRDSLIVRSVRWALSNPVDAAVYNVDYELGHQAGQSIPVVIALKNWSIVSTATGQLILEASTDSVNWNPVDSTDYAMDAMTMSNHTLHWTPPLPDIYYVRATIRPQGTDELADDNSFGIRITTLQTPTHPHLFFQASDITEMRARAATTHAAFAQALQNYCNINVNYPLSPPAQWSTANIVGISTTAALASLAAVLNPTTANITLAKRMALGMCTYPSWSNGFYDQDIYPARACFNLALAYDWLYNEFNQAQRDTIQIKLRTQIERLEGSFPQRIWWVYDYVHNHHWQAMDFMGAAAFGLWEEEPDAGRWQQCALQSLQNRMTLYGPVEDGSWFESMNYWGLITWSLMPHIYLLREELGTDYFDTPFIRSLPIYRIYGSLPEYDSMPMVNEAQSGEWYGPEDQLGFIASVHRDGEAQWMRARVLEQAGYSLDSPLDFFFWDPTVPETPPTDLARLIPDQDTYFARSAWSPSASYFSLKCGLIGGRHAFETYWSTNPRIGEFSPGHFHPDQGAFTIFYNGHYMVQSEGTEFPQHHTRTSTTILINGQGQIGDSTHGTWVYPANPLSMNPHLAETNSTPRTEYVIADATTAYPAWAGLQQFQRHFLYVRPSTFVIVDRLHTNTASSFTFCMGHRNDVWSWNTSRVLITDGSAQMTVSILQPQPWNVEKSFSYYYYSEWGGWGCRVNNVNPDTTVRFFTVFHPVTSGQEARVQQLASNANYSAMRLRGAAGLETTALIRYAPLDSATVDSISTDAEVAVVMRDSIAGRITGVTVKDSRMLRWGVHYPLLYTAPERTNLEWDYRGDTLALSGDPIAGMSIWAPTATVVRYQGVSLAFTRSGDYVVFNAIYADPSPVTGLTIAAVGDSVQLRWHAVTTDILGHPLTITGYRIYRQLGWDNDSELVADVPAGQTTATLAATADGPVYFSIICYTADRGAAKRGGTKHNPLIPYQPGKPAVRTVK